MTAPRRNHGSEQRLISFDAYCASTAADAETFCGDRDLGVTDDTLTIAEEFASNLTLEETKDILENVLRMHEMDPNFPDDVLDKVRDFLSNDDVFACPQNHFVFIHEMKIEAALITNDSPYAEVRAVVSNTDDPTIPCSTVRAWVIGLFLVIVGAAINSLFDIRQPSIAIEANVAQLLAWPMGKAAAKYLPLWKFSVLGHHVSLNPGPFNKKEHMLIAIMASNALDIPFTTFIIFSQYLPQYFNQGYAGQFGYQVLVALGTNFMGYGIAGFLRRFLVYPTYCVWPTSLVAIALNESFHSGGNPAVIGPKKRIYTASRLRWFTVVFVGMFIYFWFPNYLIQALSFFNWPTWIAPNSVHLNAITGMRNGLGFNPLPTFDWNILSFHYTSPLVVPFFNSINGFLGMFMSSFGVLALWYTNAFHTAHLPINSQRVFDRFGRHYNVSRAIDARGMFDRAKFEAYSPTYLGASYLVNYMMYFALYAATISYAFLYHRHEIWQGLRGLRLRKSEVLYKDVHNRLMAAYPEVPIRWYVAVLFFAIACAVAGITGWPTYTSPAVIFYGMALCLVFVIPIGIIQAVTGMQVSLFVLAEFIGGLIVSGNALAVNYFKGFGCITCSHALRFSHSLKLAHYVKLPPRPVFVAQLVACVASTFVCTAVMNFQMRGIPDVCREDQKSGFTCPNINTFFTATVIWGTIGPRKLFGKDGQYRILLIAFPIGFVLPFVVHFVQRRYPARKWLRYVNVVVLLHGASRWAPYNLSYYWPHVPIAWLSMVYLKTRFLGFWSKYNYVTSAALSAGVAISAIVIFFTLQYPGVALPASWWGNRISREGCEDPRSPCVLKPLQSGEAFGPRLGGF
ncbi:OPT oligopeptide transporter protein-domain-containing protein [Phyllosticta citribraziliensis]|uniref:OPT oligopeptide transporter protein-domain-containing protein n=1 Tax=Phyllosticta citribraziliensis TaxID=989973 RepID=A0ABR1L4Z0_9PEZI